MGPTPYTRLGSDVRSAADILSLSSQLATIGQSFIANINSVADIGGMASGLRHHTVTEIAILANRLLDLADRIDVHRY